jgi:glycogen synthase
MNILMLTNEYPPHIYGGAGVHVDHLVGELGRSENGAHFIQVLCFGDQKENSPNRTVTGIGPADEMTAADLRHPKLLDALHRNIVMSGSIDTADIAHCHTWYTFLAGCLLKQLLNIPLVMTIHSLEVQRPWKREQLGRGYDVTGWIEKTALVNADRIIAVSRAMKEDILSHHRIRAEKVAVIHNGIDTDTYRPIPDTSAIAAYGIDPGRPYVLFVGRETRQKGIVHLVRAVRHARTGFQLVLCAGAADTPAVAAEIDAAVAELRADTGRAVVRIREMVPTDRLVALYSQAAVFVCPSIYEPFGIINLEAMACGTPVVATAVGGIPEIVVPGETGRLVAFEPAGPDDAEPRNPRRLAQDLAAAIDSLMRSPEKRATMGTSARRRVEDCFSWKSIAARTLAEYKKLLVRPV